jgi:DNA-binding response OmpR family regulator
MDFVIDVGSQGLSKGESAMDRETRILVVEDDRSISGFLSLALADEGYCVTTAENGWIGLTLIDSFEPDLILLDMRLPVLNGRDFITVYKGSPRPAPIIGISAVRNARDLAESLGVEAFLSKPFELDELFDQIKTLIQ